MTTTINGLSAEIKPSGMDGRTTLILSDFCLSSMVTELSFYSARNSVALTLPNDTMAKLLAWAADYKENRNE